MSGSQSISLLNIKLVSNNVDHLNVTISLEIKHCSHSLGSQYRMTKLQTVKVQFVTFCGFTR